jgi:hypothetical protein
VTHGVSTVTFDDLIKAALGGHPYNQQRLGREAQRYARRLSNARAADLPEDLHDDIFSQAFVELFQADAVALARYGGKGLYRRAVLAAIRSVRAAYAPPGQRTRSAPAEKRRVAAEDVGRIADQRTIEQATAIVDGALDFDRLPDREAERDLQRIEDAVDVDKVLATAPRRVARALRLIHLSEKPVDLVAAEAMVSRFALHREITAFCATWRAAA